MGNFILYILFINKIYWINIMIKEKFIFNFWCFFDKDKFRNIRIFMCLLRFFLIKYFD